MYHVHAWYLRKPEEGIRPHETRITDNESHHMDVGIPGPLQEQHMLLTIEPSFQPQKSHTSQGPWLEFFAHV